ncbi:unnamed protein product [Rangifer tarandus platyrhynchus]|uniref:Uncharacterized protein n=2 Tax=Rangifer tarandus platyrhynchus TaxID=3082113 RepID=A0AC59YPN4_RANTA|nr:unnamed protein product [Rangifer tarandus platyrhynchus]
MASLQWCGCNDRGCWKLQDVAGGEGTQARGPHFTPAAWQGQLHVGPCASFHPRAERILVYIAEQAGRTEAFPVSNFGIAVRSFASYLGETEGEGKKKDT